MVLCSVWCRSGTSRAPLVKTANRWPSRARRACGESNLMRAAASSIASGNPSRRMQIPAIAAALTVVSWNACLAA